jgi:hypothetical protein
MMNKIREENPEKAAAEDAREIVIRDSERKVTIEESHSDHPVPLQEHNDYIDIRGKNTDIVRSKDMGYSTLDVVSKQVKKAQQNDTKTVNDDEVIIKESTDYPFTKFEDKAMSAKLN